MNNYIHRELSFLSSDGKNTVHAEIFEPKEEQIKAVVQISHGMIDYIGRYSALAEYLTDRGYIVAGCDHLGHGQTAQNEEDFGYFAKKNGYNYVIEDLKSMNGILKSRYKGLPIIMLGHSMGSFLARLYAVKYPQTIDGVIIHGTGGKNPLAPIGIALIKLLKLIFGDRHRSLLVTVLAFGSYNSKFDKSEGINAWLTRDSSMVADRSENPKTNFIFTLSGYKDLFKMLSECNKNKWYKEYPSSLPTLVVSGDADPVGGYGKGVRQVYNGLSKQGVYSLEIKIYEGARHELFNEKNREEVFYDISLWLDGVTGTK